MNDMCTHYGFMQIPFSKEINLGDEFESKSLSTLKVRLNFLLDHKGIGLVSGQPGSGKTTFVRNFVESLNPALYKVVYLHHANFTPVEFYRDLAWGLGLTPKMRRSDLCRQISANITDTYKVRRQTPFIIIDEAQFLKKDILDELLLITNYEMDSHDYMILLLVGQQAFETTLTLGDNEALLQRIVVRTFMTPMSKTETASYIKGHITRVGCRSNIFNKDAIEAIFQTEKGNMRRTNRLALLGLQMGMIEKKTIITGEHIINAATEHSYG